MASVDTVLLMGAHWVGRKTITPANFRNQFGVYPLTASWVLAHCPHVGLDLLLLLKVLWWLKQYPTEQDIQNQGVSAAHFRAKLWEILPYLQRVLPEVSIALLVEFSVVFFFVFFFAASVSPAILLEWCASRPCPSNFVHT